MNTQNSGNQEQPTVRVEQIVMCTDVNTKIDLTECKFFTGVKFTHDNGLGYSWIGYSKVSIMNVYPMVNTHNVKFFKTLDGAKRNFIKRIST